MKLLPLISPTESQFVLANQYADCVSKSFYQFKYKQDPVLVRHQHLMGKLYEFAVYNTLIQKNKVTEPDCKKHTKKHHSADLVVNNKHNIHIKGQRQEEANINGMSWLFKKSELKQIQDKDWIFLVYKIKSDFFLAWRGRFSEIKDKFAPPKNANQYDILALYMVNL